MKPEVTYEDLFKLQEVIFRVERKLWSCDLDKEQRSYLRDGLQEVRDWILRARGIPV